MRRPNREFVQNNLEYVTYESWVWFDQLLFQKPYFSTQVRYFSRDIGPLNRVKITPGQTADERLLGQEEVPTRKLIDYPDTDDPHFCGYMAGPHSSLGDWDSSSAASSAARESLIEAAGINIPRADFVLRVLAVYLIQAAVLRPGR